MDSPLHFVDPLTLAGFLTTNVKQTYTNGCSPEKTFEGSQIAVLSKLIIFIIHRPFLSSRPLIHSLSSFNKAKKDPAIAELHVDAWRLRGFSALKRGCSNNNTTKAKQERFLLYLLDRSRGFPPQLRLLL